jgi:hypothetical protein
MKDLVSHLVELKASQVALTAIPSKYPLHSLVTEKGHSLS